MADFSTALQSVITGLNVVSDASKKFVMVSDKNGQNQGIIRPEAILFKDEAVDMGLPSGTLWATKNIGAESPYQYECLFFSWGNVEGHWPNYNNGNYGTFTYNWGSSNDGPYANTAGGQLVGTQGYNWPIENDPARALIGNPWETPTTEQFAELFNSAYTKYIDANGDDVTGTNKLVTINGIVGIFLKSKVNGNTLFFPCSGFGRGQSRYNRGSDGYYWSRSIHAQTNGRYLSFNPSGVDPQNSNSRYLGFAVRPVL